MKKMKQETKKSILRVIVVIMAAAMLLGIVILPLTSSVGAEGTDVVIESFTGGSLSSAIETAKGDTDLNNITRLSVSGGTLDSADFAAICTYPNLERIELAGAEVKDGKIPDNALSSRNKLSVLSLPSNTVEIGAGAFTNNRELTRISIPSSVRVIGPQAFSGCEKITVFSIPAKTESIGEGAFADCKALESFELPEAVAEIPARCFAQCALTEIHLGPQVTKIGANAFENCHGLENVYFYGDTAPLIESGAFQNVHTTIHTYDGTEGFDSQTNDFISVAYDLSPESVYTPPADIEEPAAPAETSAETESTASDENVEDETTEEITAESDSDPEEKSDDTIVVTAAKQAAEKETHAVTVSGSDTAKSSTGGINILLVVIIAVLALACGIFGTLFFVNRKK